MYVFLYEWRKLKSVNCNNIRLCLPAHLSGQAVVRVQRNLGGRDLGDFYTSENLLNKLGGIFKTTSIYASIGYRMR